MKTPPCSHIIPENLRQQKLHQLEEPEAFFVHCSLKLYAVKQDIAQEKLLFKCSMKVVQNFHILLKQS